MLRVPLDPDVYTTPSVVRLPTLVTPDTPGERSISPLVAPPRVSVVPRSDCSDDDAASSTSPVPLDPEIVATGVSDAIPVIAN